MKQMTPEQLETAKFRAAVAAASLQGDPDRAEEFESMPIEDYAAERGIQIINPNPKKGDKRMAGKTRDQLQQELDEALDRIDELESEREDALQAFSSAFGVEIFDDGDESESDATDLDENESDED
jgi:hypothetical protein